MFVGKNKNHLDIVDIIDKLMQLKELNLSLF